MIPHIVYDTTWHIVYDTTWHIVYDTTWHTVYDTTWQIVYDKLPTWHIVLRAISSPRSCLNVWRSCITESRNGRGAPQNRKQSVQTEDWCLPKRISWVLAELNIYWSCLLCWWLGTSCTIGFSTSIDAPWVWGFAVSRGLRFNSVKTQLICFGRRQSSVCTDCFLFCGAPLPFLDSVIHLGHTLWHDLGDEDDIALRTRDMIWKANCIMRTFQGVDLIAMTRLYRYADQDLICANFIRNVRITGSYRLEDDVTRIACN